MRKLKDNIRYELNYMTATKIPVFILLSILSIFIMTQFNIVNTLNHLNRTFESSVSHAKQNGDDIQQLLEEDYYSKDVLQDNGMVNTTIENVVRYDYESVKTYYQKIQGGNGFIEILSNTSLVFLPIIASIFAIYIATYDFSANTLKTRMLSGDFKLVYMSKLIGVIVVFTSMFVLSLVIGYGIAYGWSTMTQNDRSLFFKDIPYQSVAFIDVFLASMVTYGIALASLLIAFGFGLMCKKGSVAILIFLVYHLVIPSLGKYDFKNIILNIHASMFGVNVQSVSHTQLSLTMTTTLLLSIVSLFLVCGYLRFYKMSKYTV